MTYVQSIDSQELRIIVCFEYDAHAPPAEVEALKHTILESPQTIHAVDCTGDFSLMFEVAAPSLPWFHDWLEKLRKQSVKLVRSQACSFVCRRFVRRPKDDRALWVPSQEGLKRVDCSLVDKVEADGDYVKIHAQGQTWIVHSTMHAIRDFLGNRKFVQLHRSVIVRAAFIDRLAREGRHWIAHLKDATSEPVAQGHTKEVLDVAHSSLAERRSPNPGETVDAWPLRSSKMS